MPFDLLPADQIDAMAALSQLMQAIKMSRQFDAMAQGRGRFCRLIDRRRALPFPLPASTAVECFRENVLSFGTHIDPHLARPGGAITPVHRKIRIDDAQVNCDGVDRFDGLPATHRPGIAFNHLVDRIRSATAARQDQGNRKDGQRNTTTSPTFILQLTSPSWVFV